MTQEALSKCSQIGCSQARYGKNCSYRNCELHPNYDEQYVTKNLCTHPKTWWTCSFCDEVTCQGCHAFKLPTVTHCINCFKEWMKKHNLSNFEEYKTHVERGKGYAQIGHRLIQAIKLYESKTQ